MWNREAEPKPQAAPPARPTSQPTTQPVPQSTSHAASTTPTEERRQVAWVGKSVLFRGDLISSEDMTIDGRIEGTIEIRDHHLSVGPNASVSADIVAKVVTVFGKIAGSITAGEKIELRKGASVEADVICQALAIQEGAYFCGKVDMTGRPQADAATGGTKAEKARQPEPRGPATPPALEKK